MNFTEAKKEYDFIKYAYYNGLIKKEDLIEKIEHYLIVIDDKNDIWKIDINSGKWLCQDPNNKEWFLKKSPLMEEDKGDYSIVVKPPKTLTVDENLLEKNNSSVVKSKNLCHRCQSPLKENSKFCTSCGEKVEWEKSVFCEQCGAKIYKDNKFCTNCGNKVIPKK